MNVPRKTSTEQGPPQCSVEVFRGTFIGALFREQGPNGFPSKEDHVDSI